MMKQTIWLVLLTLTAFEAEANMTWNRHDVRRFVEKQFSASTYDAISPHGKRKSVSSHIESENRVLDSNRRQRLSAQAMDAQRNDALAAWAIRQHLNYVSLFDFFPCTPDREFNNDLKTLMQRDNRRENCDVGGRHSWNRIRRLLEARKTLDGDSGLTKLRSGYVQGIESHAIANPRKPPRGENWELGVRLGRGRRATGYNVKERDRRGRTVDRFISARNMFLFGAFEGRFDQSRGISSFASGMMKFRDTQEGFDYAMANLKVRQLFAMAITRERDKFLDPTHGLTGRQDANPTEGDEEDDIDPQPRVKFDGPQILELDEGEDAQFLHVDSPGGNTQEFLRLYIHIALLSLDIPMNFFDPKYVNFAGGRTSWNQYERSCVDKREEQLALHDWYTDWRVTRWMLPRSAGGTGELILPRGWTIDDVCWEWVPRGVPWWKPEEELESELLAAQHGLDNLERIARRHNLGDVRENLRVNAEIMEFARKELGIDLVIGPKQPSVNINTGRGNREDDAEV